MKKTYLSRSVIAAVATLTLAIGFFGCGGNDSVTKLNQANVRGQLKDNFKSAIESMANQAKTSGNNAFSSTVTNIKGLVGIDLGAYMPSGFDGEAISKVVDKFFESDFAQAVFAETNISSRTDTEVTYKVDAALCDKLKGLGPTKEATDEMIGMCKLFLSKNAIDLKVKSLPEKGMELELWHATTQAGAVKKFVVSLLTAPTSLGSKLNLDASKDLVAAILEMQPNKSSSGASASLAGVPFSGIKTLKGALSFELRFKSGTLESGCKNNEKLCFNANVDEDIDVKIEGSEPISVQFAKSPKDNPTASIFANADNGFSGAFNLGALDANLGKAHIFVEASQFVVTVPEQKKADEISVIVENFKAGAKPSFFEGVGQKVVLDLANDSRVIEKIKFVKDASSFMVELSPFSVILSKLSQIDPECKTSESIKFTTDAHETTRLVSLIASDNTSDVKKFSKRRFFSGGKIKKKQFYSNVAFEDTNAHVSADAESETPTEPAPLCSEYDLSSYSVFSNLNITTEGCGLPGGVSIAQGSAQLEYKYKINSAAEKTLSFQARQGQCARP